MEYMQAFSGLQSCPQRFLLCNKMFLDLLNILSVVFLLCGAAAGLFRVAQKAFSESVQSGPVQERGGGAERV